MSPELLIAFVGFALVTSGTPGPNNVMLMASGANFGLRRTLPHIAGIVVGLVSMIVLLGLGLAGLFERVPALHRVLKVCAVLYLLYLAWRIARAAPATPDAPDPEARPMTWFEAAAFQWVNPKAWAMALTTVTAYLPDRAVTTLVLAALTFSMVTLCTTSFWTSLGQQLRRFLTSPARMRGFNLVMAALLVATLWPIVTH